MKQYLSTLFFFILLFREAIFGQSIVIRHKFWHFEREINIEQITSMGVPPNYYVCRVLAVSNASFHLRPYDKGNQLQDTTMQVDFNRISTIVHTSHVDSMKIDWIRRQWYRRNFDADGLLIIGGFLASVVSAVLLSNKPTVLLSIIPLSGALTFVIIRELIDRKARFRVSTKHFGHWEIIKIVGN